jgi:hypothetical protein
LDVLVRPSGRIIDYNTRYSGVTADMFDPPLCTLGKVTVLPEEQLKSQEKFVPFISFGSSDGGDCYIPFGSSCQAKPSYSLSEIRRLLLDELFHSSTILVGHSIDSDLKALRVCIHFIITFLISICCSNTFKFLQQYGSLFLKAEQLFFRTN